MHEVMNLQIKGKKYIEFLLSTCIVLQRAFMFGILRPVLNIELQCKLKVNEDSRSFKLICILRTLKILLHAFSQLPVSHIYGILTQLSRC